MACFGVATEPESRQAGKGRGHLSPRVSDGFEFVRKLGVGIGLLHAIEAKSGLEDRKGRAVRRRAVWHRSFVGGFSCSSEKAMSVLDVAAECCEPCRCNEHRWVRHQGARGESIDPFAERSQPAGQHVLDPLCTEEFGSWLVVPRCQGVVDGSSRVTVLQPPFVGMTMGETPLGLRKSGELTLQRFGQEIVEAIPVAVCAGRHQQEVGPRELLQPYGRVLPPRHVVTQVAGQRSEDRPRWQDRTVIVLEIVDHLFHQVGADRSVRCGCAFAQGVGSLRDRGQVDTCRPALGDLLYPSGSITILPPAEAPQSSRRLLFSEPEVRAIDHEEFPPSLEVRQGECGSLASSEREMHGCREMIDEVLQ